MLKTGGGEEVLGRAAGWQRTLGRLAGLLARGYRMLPPMSRDFLGRLRRRPRTMAGQKARPLPTMPYKEQPRVSVIVQSFNQAGNVALLERRLRATCMDELIVCEDGSIDGSLEMWLARLPNPNDFLLRSNDLHEIRACGRAIDLARGEIVCLMQDDDHPPKEGGWLAEALRLFELHPGLAILGGWVGFTSYFSKCYNAPWVPLDKRGIPFADPQTGRPFMFVENVNIGPYLFRRSVYQELGGFDLRFSEPGAPGICFESELCYRAWERGYQVGLTDIPTKIPIDGKGNLLPGGTLLWGRKERFRNELVNKRRIAELHGRHLPAVQAAVRKANTTLRSLSPGAGGRGSGLSLPPTSASPEGRGAMRT